MHFINALRFLSTIYSILVFDFTCDFSFCLKMMPLVDIIFLCYLTFIFHTYYFSLIRAMQHQIDHLKDIDFFLLYFVDYSALIRVFFSFFFYLL